MDNHNNDIQEIIIRYLDESATLHDKQTLLQWLKESETNRNDFIETRDLWLSCDAALADEAEIDRALSRLKNRIQNEVKTNRAKFPARYYWYQFAAIMLLVVGFGLWSVLKQTNTPREVVLNQLITAKGSKGQYVLPDGSIVWLNSESKLTFPEKFSKEKRKVTLEGEGYFQVTENRKQPFIVETDDIEIEVLGTAFDISNYAFQSTIDVVLLSGSVKVKEPEADKETLLSPNDLFIHNKKHAQSWTQTTNPALHIDWIKNRLTFDNDKLSDIIISLEGWYTVTIDCPVNFAQKTRMSFTVRNENINEILKAMSLIIPITYSIDGQEVRIVPK